MSTNRETSYGLWQILPHRWTRLRNRSRELRSRLDAEQQRYDAVQLGIADFDLSAAALERHAAQAELHRFGACQTPGRYLFTEGSAEIPHVTAELERALAEHVPTMGYADFFRTLTRELGLATSDPQSTEQLAARVSAARAEVTAMNLALDEGRDPCECGTWQVTWDAAHQRWICSDCADNAATYEAWQIGPALEYERVEYAVMQGISTVCGVYDEIAHMSERNECMDAAPAAARTTEQRSIDYRCSRERFVRAYAGYGLDIVRPEDHIRLTGV